MAKSSWRFEFVDINKSIDVTEESTQWIGYAVVRAPKGETEAKYIPPANQARIEAMFGYASADYPDLYELIDFNRNYGVYVSAPSAENKNHPNYYGGVYLTSKGLQQFYHVTDKKAPNFMVGIQPGKEMSYGLGATENTTIGLTLNDPDKANEQAYIDFFNIPATIFNKCDYLDFDDWKSGKTVRYTLDKASGVVGVVVKKGSQEEFINCGTLSPSENNSENKDPRPGCYDIRLGGSKEQNLDGNDVELNTPRDTEVPFIRTSDLKGIDGKSANYKNLVKGSWDEWYVAATEDGEAARLKKAIIEGTTFTSDANNVLFEKTFAPIGSYFHLAYDIKNDVYAHIAQVSPTAYETHITIDSVVYDKYVYDEALCFTNVTSKEDLPSKGTREFKNCDGKVLFLPSGVTEIGSEAGVYVYNYDHVYDGDTDTGEEVGWELQTNYETKKILAINPLFEEDKSTDAYHKIFFIEDGFVVEMSEDNPDSTYQLKVNPLYNSFHSTAYEYDIGDERHNSYDFTGSLDEFGVDENGSENYWEELLPPGEAVTYAEVYVDRTFDDELDKFGVWMGGERIVATPENPKDVTVSGQRYVDYLVEQNIKNGNTGGDVSNEQDDVTKNYAKCIRLGLEEAAAPKYEDAIIFMEYSGIDSVKTYFNAIRTNHKMATIISPKNITEATFNNVSKIRVTNPLRGSAQYCQELQYKDKNLRKKYYSCPIGAMGAMLMRIIERRYGGVAPMWINDQGMGGQIEEFMSRAPLKARWDFEDEDTKILDQKQINPILMDSDSGVYAASHRTTEMYSGDWGYLGHSMAFDLCKREIRDFVMKPQIGKLINDYWMDKRQEQVDRILGNRTSGSDQIWSYANCDIRSVNNEYTRAQRIFNIAVDVRVNPFSEKVRLTFTNLSQITTTSE